MGINYQTDTPQSVYSEFVALENEIERIGRNMKTLADKAETASANYELAKNQDLIAMFAEEAGDPANDVKPFKRTEAQRESLYRTKNNNLRLLRGLSAADLKSERDLLNALSTKMDGLQSRKGLILIERDRQTGNGI